LEDQHPVFLPLLKERTSSATSSDAEEILLRANILFRDAQSKDLRSAIAEKLADLRRYDILAMDRVLAILMWGRSGSILLASYLDGHEDVIMLPESRGYNLYDFFVRYQSLPLRDKLLAYPADVEYTDFFQGVFAISPAKYYAAVEAILAFSSNFPAEFVDSRRAFFLFVHIAYTLAIGRRPASPNPLIVYAQHWPDNTIAEYLVDDFPLTKFVHTVRDPITSCDAFFHYHVKALAERFILLPYSALCCLTDKDRPHFRMEARTRTVRFEDLHSDIAETMHDLSDWLGLSFQSALLDSTFNGIPYVVKRDGVTWSGRRLEQTERQARYLSLKDRTLMFALFYENFVDWRYPCPKIFKYRIVRCLVVVLLVLLPMKMEIIGAEDIFRRRFVPSLQRGEIASAIRSLLAIGECRLRIIWIVVRAFSQRCFYRPRLLQVALEPREVGTEGHKMSSVSL
jgi:hypothetical protein